MRGPIADALHGKTVLLTGGTGFLGKVVLERLLRAAPTLGRVYLLIRERDDGNGFSVGARARFESEILGSGAFASLARDLGGEWPRVARAKLVPVAGDVSEPLLGLGAETFATLASSVDVVLHAAASVAFDEPLDEALLHNTRSAKHVAGFARACRSAVLVHVSTAFVSGKRDGRIMESALAWPDAGPEIAEIEAAVAAVARDREAGRLGARAARARLVEEGRERARRLGWHDTYTFTKALGEMEIARHRGDVPTAIVRPTIIESALRDPLPGWLENLNVGDPVLAGFGRGHLPDFPLSREAVVDFVPVDLVANAVVALLPRVAESQEIGYYAVGTGSVNPLRGRELYDLAEDYFTRHPMRDARGRPIPLPRWTFPTPRRFREMFGDEARRGTRTRWVTYLADLYGPYTNGDRVFDTTNTRRLLDELDDADREALDFDVRRIDWRSYLQDIHIPGLRRHVLGERPRVAERVEAHG